MKIRHYVNGDEIPKEFELGFLQYDLTPELAWVAEDEGGIFAILVAYVGHGFIFPLRLCSMKNSHPTWLLKMFRYIAAEMKDQGIRFFMYIGSSQEKVTQALGNSLLEAGAKFAKMEDLVWIGGETKIFGDHPSGVIIPMSNFRRKHG